MNVLFTFNAFSVSIILYHFLLFYGELERVAHFLMNRSDICISRSLVDYFAPVLRRIDNVNKLFVCPNSRCERALQSEASPTCHET